MSDEKTFESEKCDKAGAATRGQHKGSRGPLGWPRRRRHSGHLPEADWDRKKILDVIEEQALKWTQKCTGGG